MPRLVDPPVRSSTTPGCVPTQPAIFAAADGVEQQTRRTWRRPSGVGTTSELVRHVGATALGDFAGGEGFFTLQRGAGGA
jgi:hypothetical protein